MCLVPTSALDVNRLNQTTLLKKNEAEHVVEDYLECGYGDWHQNKLRSPSQHSMREFEVKVTFSKSSFSKYSSLSNTNYFVQGSNKA